MAQHLEPHAPRAGSAFTARSSATCLLVASLAMLAVLAYAGRWLTFWSDEWKFLFLRADPGMASLVRGSDVHLHFFPVLIYQALFRVAGLGSYYPYLCVAWTLHLACAWLLFALAGRLAGWGFGLVAGLSLLCLGSGFEVLLQPGQMGYSLSEATGLLAVLLLVESAGRPRARLRRALAAAALCVAVASSGVGMIFVGLIAVWTAARRDWRALGAAIPALALFAAWFPIWSERTTERMEPTLSHLLQVPAYVVHGAGATVVAVLGLSPERFALVGAAVGIAAIAILVWLGGRFGALALAALAALAAEFVLVAGFRPSFGIDWTSRSGYLHPAVAFLWLAGAAICGGERLRGRLARLSPWIVAPVLALAVAGNMAQLGGAARGMRVQRANEVACLRLLEALRGSPDLDWDAGGRITPRRYFAAIDRFGVPRLASAEPTLANLGRADPHELDRCLVTVVGQGIRPAVNGHVEGQPFDVAVSRGRAAQTGESCTRVSAGGDPARAIWAAGARAFTLEAVPPQALRAMRVGVFGSPRQPIEATATAGIATMRLPTLPGGLEWSIEIEVAPGGSVTVCRAAAGG